MKVKETNGVVDLIETDLIETDEFVEAPEDIRTIELPVIVERNASVTVKGITPLIVHRFDEKAQKMMEDKTTGVAMDKKPLRNPEELWRDAAYVVPGCEKMKDWTPGKYYFPASAFKHVFLYGVALLGDTKKMPKNKATGYMFPGEDPVLQFESVSLRKDTVRIQSGTAMIAYRPQFNEWSCDLDFSYDGNAITLEQVVALLDRGGFAGGIGEWRPSSPKNKSGSYGRFRVESVRSA